jgi:hypothetical protein
VINFEIRQTLRVFNKIKHVQMQIAAKSSKIYANLQPGAPRRSMLILVLVGLMRVHRT